MLEVIKSIAVELAFAGMLGIAAWLLKNRKNQLIAYINSLILMAEEGIKGSGLGVQKKEWVLTQLEIIGTKVTPTVDALIDELVAIMNDKQSSLTSAAEQAATDALDGVGK